MEKRTFRIAMSERCYRFKPDALSSHAPNGPGVYEFVMFDTQLRPIVLYIGVALQSGVRNALAAHLMGNARPTADELSKLSKDVYFDFVASADVSSPDDYRDVAGALIARHRPRLNGACQPPFPGRYREVVLEEAG